jgi:phage FluMu gp28-like protein
MLTADQKVIMATTALTEMNESYSLDFWQEWYIRSLFKFLIAKKSRRIGWSYVTSLKSIIEANDFDVWKYQLVFVSYGMHDAIGKISDARNALMNIPEKWRKQISSDSKTSLEFWDEGKKSKSQLISLPNRTLRGFGTTNPIGGVSLDEFAFHKDDDKVYESALPTLTRGGLLSIGSTPLTKTGMFYNIHSDEKKYDKFKRITIPWWWSSALCIDVKTAIKVAPDLTTAERVEAFGTDTIKMLFASLSLTSFQQEFECTFTDESEAFISLEMINACTPQPVESYEYQGIDELLNGATLSGICTGLDVDGTPIFETVYAPAYDHMIHGTLYAGWDMGRTKDASIFTLIARKGDKYRILMSYELRNKKFDEQKAFAKLALSSLPIHCFNIDRNGLGMDFAEWAETHFPLIAHGVNFTNETKEEMANAVYLATERQQYIFPMNQKLHADIHSIRKTVTAMKYNRYDGRTKDSHADRFWSLALATVGIDDSMPKENFYAQYQKKKERSTTKKSGTPELEQLNRFLNRRRRRDAR